MSEENRDWYGEEQQKRNPLKNPMIVRLPTYTESKQKTKSMKLNSKQKVGRVFNLFLVIAVVLICIGKIPPIFMMGIAGWQIGSWSIPIRSWMDKKSDEQFKNDVTKDDELHGEA